MNESSAEREPRADPAADLHADVDRLRRLLARLTPPAAEPPLSLLLADAAMESAIDAPAGRPAQVAVLGPTQSGKSTIVNLLAGAAVAGVSPLASYTRRPQALAAGIGAAEAADLAALAERAGAGVPQSVAAPEGLAACAVWDTPDFDSLSAGEYVGGVLRVAALADTYCIVVSKEKYADLAVWELLELLAPLGRPWIIVLNKITPDAAEVVTRALRARLAALRAGASAPPIVVIPYLAGLGEDAARALPAAAIELRQAVTGALAAAAPRDERARLAGVLGLIERGWEGWTAPARAQHAAIGEWERSVEDVGADILHTYQRDYLDHPQRYDAFRRATLELLHLLEVPGLSAPLTHVRQVLTWPVRTLIAAGRELFTRRPSAAAERAPAPADAILGDALRSGLMRLRFEAARQLGGAPPGAPVWRGLAQALQRGGDALEAELASAAAQVQQEAQHAVQAAANQLFETLRQRPALLNALRAARTTTDVAAIALTIKTGGLHLNDLLFAPAMLALTSSLTEGALGSYMVRVSAELKLRLFENVRVQLIERVWRPRLAGLAGALQAPGVIPVSPGELAEGAAAVGRLKAEAV